MGSRNLIDAANLAALAALLSYKRPECTVGGDDGQEIIVHPPEVCKLNMHQLNMSCWIVIWFLLCILHIT